MHKYIDYHTENEVPIDILKNPDYLYFYDPKIDVEILDGGRCVYRVFSVVNLRDQLSHYRFAHKFKRITVDDDGDIYVLSQSAADFIGAVGIRQQTAQLKHEFIEKRRLIDEGCFYIDLHHKFSQGLLQEHEYEMNDLFLTCQQQAMAKTLADKPDFLTRIGLKKPEMSRFPRSLYQQPVPLDNSAINTELSLNSESVKALVKETICITATNYQLSLEVADPNFELRLTRPMIANNLICSKNSISEKPCLYTLDHWRRRKGQDYDALKKHCKESFAEASPFRAWQRFIDQLSARDLHTEGGQPDLNWLSDLKPVNADDQMPLPLFISKKTREYWVFAWHGTPQSAQAGIERSGFKMAYSKEGYYGPGFYTAIESSKALTYARNNRRSASEPFSGCLMVCASNLGKNPQIFADARASYTNCLNLMPDLSWREHSAKIVLPNPSRLQLQYEFITPLPPTVLFCVTAKVPYSNDDLEILAYINDDLQLNKGFTNLCHRDGIQTIDPYWRIYNSWCPHDVLNEIPQAVAEEKLSTIIYRVDVLFKLNLRRINDANGRQFLALSKREILAHMKSNAGFYTIPH
ncbi:MAG: hypothetical protein ACO2ZM_06915 [Francisellaceae bacterium]